MPRRKLAKRAACLQVVRRLYQLGELNDELRTTAIAKATNQEVVLASGEKVTLDLGYMELYPIKVAGAFFSDFDSWILWC